MTKTSITIDDVVFVIDYGKAKETSYDALNNTHCLLPTWISKDSAKQRRGRAGCVQPGECYHLYPRDVQSLCLQIKTLKLGSFSEFLSKALQSPELLAAQNAIEYLKIIGALDENEDLTLAEAAKAQFSRDHSDHFALVRVYDVWKVAEQALGGYEYCWKIFLSAQSMKSIDSLRREFLSLLKDTSVVKGNMVIFNAWNYDENLIRVAICYGLYPGTSSIVHNEKSLSLKTVEDGQVLLHSDSVNSWDLRIPFPWLVFNEKIKVNSIFLRLLFPITSCYCLVEASQKAI
ncbi:unnamed protein product [Lactuca virosa]|uniref:RNA helicase n=1 Tax=Lactuca virosa TaxID=75947 RepID=A0AAU9MFA7_9ASTR|nr:unnamed protein product [Lactuca virosa]